MSTTMSGKMLLLLHCSTLMLFIPASQSLSIDRIGLLSNFSSVSVQTKEPAAIGCWYTLGAGEELLEAVISKSGKMLQHTAVKNEDSMVEFDISPVTRKDAGSYLCSVRTQQGGHATKKYDLFVIDTPVPTYSTSSHVTDCKLNITCKTPGSYPEMTVFCGIIVDTTDANGDPDTYWLEPPPTRDLLESPSYDEENLLSSRSQSASQSKLSYSTERGEFQKIEYGDGLIKYELNEVIIDIAATPHNSSWKCFTGYYTPKNEFIPSFTVKSSIQQSLEETQCLANVTDKYADDDDFKVSYSVHTTRSCRGTIGPTWSSDDLEATIRCEKTSETIVLQCQGRTWMLKKDGQLVESFDKDIQEFVKVCDEAEDNSNGDGDDNGGVRGLTASSGTVAMAGILLALLHFNR